MDVGRPNEVARDRTTLLQQVLRPAIFGYTDGEFPAILHNCRMHAKALFTDGTRPTSPLITKVFS